MPKSEDIGLLRLYSIENDARLLQSCVSISPVHCTNYICVLLLTGHCLVCCTNRQPAVPLAEHCQDQQQHEAANCCCILKANTATQHYNVTPVFTTAITATATHSVAAERSHL